MEIDDNTKSYVWIVNNYIIDESINRTFSRRSRDSKKVVIKDSGKINKIRKRTRFFQSQKANIKQA